MIGFQKIRVLFFTILAVKILMAALIVPNEVSLGIIEFVKSFVADGFQNPYKAHAQSGQTGGFPYPSLMLFVLAVPEVILSYIKDLIPYTPLHNIIQKLPILIADFVVLWVLLDFLKEKKAGVVWLYWLSPVLIFINYIYGQYDVIPLALMFVSLRSLFKDKLTSSAIWFGLALACKTHIVLALPFILISIISNKSLMDGVKYFVITSASFVLINALYIGSPEFINMVFNNSEQSKIWDASFNAHNGLKFYVIPCALMLLLCNAYTLKAFNRNIVVMFLGFAFGVILLFIPPMPGWYYWIIPFMIYFFVKEKGRAIYLFLALQISFLAYLALNTQDVQSALAQFNITPEQYTLLTGLAFTVLQTLLFICCALIYGRGIKSYRKHKITSTPYLIGIGGNSGTGKTTLSNSLKRVFGDNNAMVLCGDAMHKWERNDTAWEQFTHLNPKANNLHKEINYLQELKSKKKIYRRYYDHKTGKFTNEKLIRAKKINIFEGLHPFYLESQRRIYDLKIFVKPDDKLALHWKIVRDVHERGYSIEKVMNQINVRQDDLQAYINTQSSNADIMFEILPSHYDFEIGDQDVSLGCVYRITLPNSVYVEDFLERFSHVEELKIEHAYTQGDKQTITISGEISADEIANICDAAIPALLEIGVNGMQWPADAYGCGLALIIYYIFESTDHGM